MDPSLEASLIQLAMGPLEPGPQQIVRIHQFDGLLSSRSRDKLQSLRELTGGLPLLKSQTAENFLARNDSALGDQRELALSEQFTILSEAVRKEVFDSNDRWDCWDRFKQCFPGSNGLIVSSRLGIDSEMTQALVCIGQQFHGLSGAGYYRLLLCTDGVWSTGDVVLNWVS